MHVHVLLDQLTADAMHGLVSKSRAVDQLFDHTTHLFICRFGVCSLPSPSVLVDNIHIANHGIE